MAETCGQCSDIKIKVTTFEMSFISSASKETLGLQTHRLSASSEASVSSKTELAGD